MAARNAFVQARRHASSKIVPHGPGGRSSVSGVVATVFGCDWDKSGSFVGRYTVGRLGRIGSQVVVPYRGCELNVRHLRVMGDLGQIHFPQYQLLNKASVESATEYSNVVINLAGQEYQSRHFSLEDVNVDGARIVARAAAEAGATRLIHMSALGADVDSPSEFLRTKALGEQAVLEEFPEATIIRPATLIGDEDTFLNRLAEIAGLPGPFPLGLDGSAVKQPVYAVDVAAAIVATLSEPASVGQTYELVGPKSYTMKEICDYIAETTRNEFWTIPVPEGPLTSALKIPFSIAQKFRLELLPNETEYYRYNTHETVTKGLPGLSDLGIEATPMEQIGINALRRFRRHIYHDDILEE